MISFTNKRYYAKGTCNVICADRKSGDIVYQSNKFNTGSITTNSNMNEIRAGLGNPIAAMIPSDSSLEVDFEAADFSLWAKGAQVGATLSYNAPVPVCQTITAAGTSITVDIKAGEPVAQLGTEKPQCYVQEVGTASEMGKDGAAYDVNPATGAITGFTAETGKKYKVWFFIRKASAQVATLSTMFDPSVIHFTAQIAVYANENAGGDSEGTRVGWLYVIIPNLKLKGEGGIKGDQGNNDTTKISGQAVAYEPEIVSETCSDCDTSTLGYYVFAPDDASSSIMGLTVFGGVTEVAQNSTVQLPVRFVMADGSTVRPSSYSDGFTYTLDGAPTGTTISTNGIITAGEAAGDCDCTTTYTDGGTTHKVVSTITVTA